MSVPVPEGATAANPDSLDGYVAAMTVADQAANDASAGVEEMAAAWNALGSPFGGRIDLEGLAAVDSAIDELSYLDLWVGRVATAFRNVERLCPSTGCGPIILAGDYQIDMAVGSASLSEAVAEGMYGHLFTVERDGADGRTRVVRLMVDDRPDGMSELEWQLVLEEMGVADSAGPLHIVVHGWGGTSEGATNAGLTTADLYDQQGVEGATVLVVDWDAGDGAGGLGTIGDFTGAESSAEETGDDLAPMFTALAAANPDAEVNITAHSLGNHVVSRALTKMDDPTARFSVSLLMVQPAIPRMAPTWDTDSYGALVSPRVRDLTVTINNDDGALFWYELINPQALGDEAADGRGITALVEWRDAAGLDTQVVDHDSGAGDGHLGLNPNGDQTIVRSLTQEEIDRDTDGGTGQRELREWLFETYDWTSPEEILDHPPIQEYLDLCQETGVDPDPEHVRMIIERDLHPPAQVPTGTTTSVPTPEPVPEPQTPAPSPGPTPTPTPTATEPVTGTTSPTTTPTPLPTTVPVP